MTIGDALLVLRKTAKLTQAELGEIVGVSSGSISHFEKGRGLPGNAIRQALSEYFGFPLALFLDSIVVEQRPSIKAARDELFAHVLSSVAQKANDRKVTELTRELAELTRKDASQ